MPRTALHRSLAALVLVLSLLCGAAATNPDRADAATVVGVGDQQPGTFTDPLFGALGLKRSRYFTPWDTALRPEARQAFDHWITAARAQRVEALVAFNSTSGSRCPARPCRLPSVKEYSRAFRAFRARYPDVRVIAPWNEANHRSQPTFKNPRRAAAFYNVVRRGCQRCKVVAADVIDERNMVRWLRVFRRHARKPRLWGLHNYRDVNPRRNQLLGGTRRLLKAVRGRVWLTETGGIVRFVLPNGGRLFPANERRAAGATRKVFGLARRYRRRIARVYLYHWRQPALDNRFDAGLLRADGTPRPAYRSLRRHLASPHFAP